ncbi:leucyl aminopeptidase family protein [Nocardioides acrostichi]|uniref:Probable cytosol aminopeptidase n=1 Tax=Nocardioides acrostichi TaxID=2784339 RepID=A0A930UWX2_9ACTN|nr:leucyl aminopeptidase family protein [Nocardioides acrostichi]MBF4162373.1 leucyl aminopeptidase family protein [Nocardioides acrostichi]
MSVTPPTPVLPAQVSPPELSLASGHLATVDADVLAVPVLTGDDGSAGVLLGPGADELGEQLGLDLLAVAELHRLTGAVGETASVVVPGPGPDSAGRLVLLLGAGSASATDLRRAAATLARSTTGRRRVATSLASLGGDDALIAVAVGAVLGSFRFSWRSAPAPTDATPPEQILLTGVARDAEPTLRRGVALGGAGWRARHLATVPSNLKNPGWLAEQAATIAAESGLTCEIFDEGRLADEGFGGILGVGRASASPPRLIRLDYTPAGRRAARKAPTVVLVGKGITFDSGGLSIKPAEAMASMKRDMTGGAVVLATMAALAAVECPVRVVALVAAAENAVGGDATRPGDVLRHYGGRTTEVTNTDAEGRLVMADALAYAVANLEPAALVDVATLTGAMKVALGLRTGGFFADDEALASALAAAGEGSGERLWRMPLVADYAERIDSSVADSDNAGGSPGAVTAALFLQPFTGDVPWAHLDIASVGDSAGENFEWTTGPTGFGARALLTWLGSDDPLAGVGVGV